MVEERGIGHKGGQLRFGPDGMLYVGLGDGGPVGDPRLRVVRLGGGRALGDRALGPRV